MVNVLRYADASRLGYSFEPGRHVHPVAHDVVTFDQHVSEVDADAELHPLIRRRRGISLRHELLNADRAFDRGDD